MWHTYTDPTEERTASVFSTEGKVCSSCFCVSSVKFCLIKRLHFPEYCIYTTSFLCISATYPFSCSPLPGKLRRSSSWLLTERPTFYFRHKLDFSVSYCLLLHSVDNSSSSQAVASGSITGGKDSRNMTVTTQLCLIQILCFIFFLSVHFMTFLDTSLTEYF
jgi:hypothetical protein